MEGRLLCGRNSQVEKCREGEKQEGEFEDKCREQQKESTWMAGKSGEGVARV